MQRQFRANFPTAHQKGELRRPYARNPANRKIHSLIKHLRGLGQPRCHSQRSLAGQQIAQVWDASPVTPFAQ
ncbi:hypothetical protein CSC3H3_13760 [Thalassospira marina]|uniref:DUF4817 domain-containing protein n=1 Tax=Thalassospira marina TaxID=2048283 RepID=A0ABM6QAW2_9PROT|nr:hypothetical protein CSC3H3_13760 [Thalassospira marina]